MEFNVAILFSLRLLLAHFPTLKESFLFVKMKNGVVKRENLLDFDV